MKNRILLFITLVAAFAFAGNVPKGSFTDPRDGKTYKTVKIGYQVWMAENLNYETDSSYCYEDKPANCHKYGRLYADEAAKRACPKGWRLPDEEDWITLFEVVGEYYPPEEGGSFYKFAAKKLKSASGWKNNGNGTDEFGFSAKPAGGRRSNGEYFDAGKAIYWPACFCFSSYDDVASDCCYEYFPDMFSVRCLRDSE